MDWKDRKVLVLGLGDTGLSMTRWLHRRGARVTVADTRSRPPHAPAVGAELPHVSVKTGAFDAGLFSDIDAIAISPGIDPRQSPVAEAMLRGVPTVGDVELFAQGISELARERSTPRPKVLAITGSNGKSTVTMMTGEVLRRAGRRTIVAGNIGLPVLDALGAIEGGEPLPDAFVLELSSFQLETTRTLHADAATVLNVTEDHLDRYDGMEEYAAAKARIFEGGGAQILNREDTRSMNMARPGRHVVTFGVDAPPASEHWGIRGESMLARGTRELLPAADLPVAGLHNASNALASLALAETVGLPPEAMLPGLLSFRGLPHRLERVAEVRRVTFYDDSKGTNVGATVAALNGMSVPVVLIAGGDGKGQAFTPLRAAIAAHARAVVLIGRDANEIAQVLEGLRVDVVRAGNMEEAVERAFKLGRPGDAVLLSPACASYDMFRSYVHRGQVFVEAVRRIERREGAS
jgi:UDP-N-acetylmuramoylalanine--D-glutamate ligase